MAYNIFKPRGSTKAEKPDAGGAVLRSTPVFGIVKDNIDPIRSGRLRVYVADMGGLNPDNSDSWVTVNYMSPFYGVTKGDPPKEGYGTYLKNPSSYGMWNSPPDIGTTVICIFINGDPNYGYWIGCVPEPEALHMVPAIGASETVVLNDAESQSYGGATKLPVSNINSNNSKINDSALFFNEPKPVHSYLAGILAQQGLIRDNIRGTIGTSAQRETPSRVGWGVNTPGRPIYEGGFTDETIAQATRDNAPASALKVISRRAGHSIVMDDGDLIGRDQLIRLRSSLGHQILMSDDGQTIFVIHANGQSWVELGKEGTIDLYATNSVNVRTQGDLNLHADNNININAKKDLNIYGENINIESEKKTNVKVGTDYSTEVSGKYTSKTGDRMSFESKGDASFASPATTYINGEKINLNTGATSLVPQEVKPLPRVAHTDTLFDKTKGWAAAPGSLISIVSRAPAHAPWAQANQGVDVKINNDADANFPSAPSAPIAALNATAGPPSIQIQPSVAATVPAAGAISKALDTNAATAMVGQVAAVAQSSDAIKTATAAGAGVVETAEGAVAVVGNLAQTPQQLESAGIIKTGGAALIGSLVAAGQSVQSAMTPNLFTGKAGAENLNNLIANPVAQVKAQVANFQQAQTQLTTAGVITGKESAGQLGGLVTSAATAGVANTVNALKNAAGQIGAAITGPVSNLTGAANKLLGSASSMISSGNFAANMASSVTGGLSSIAGALSGATKNLGSSITSLIDSAKGIAGSAFALITKSFPSLKAGVPQNLKQIADQASAAAQSVGSSVQSAVAGASTAIQNAGTTAAAAASGVASSATNPLTGIGASVMGAVSTVSNAVSTTASSISGAITGAATAMAAVVNKVSPGALTTGLSAIPGAEKAVTTVVNNAKDAINKIPGTDALGSAAKDLSAAVNTGARTGAASNVLNALKKPGATLQSLASAGLPTAAMSQLNSAISSLSSGGAVPIKLPTVGVNTTDRSSVMGQLGAVLGSTKIPVPNYSGNPASVGETEATSAASDTIKKLKELNAVQDEIAAATPDLKKAKKDFVEASNNLPAGDPGIASAEAAYLVQLKRINALLDKSSALSKSITG